MFKSLPLSKREVKITEARMEALYDAARLGLKGDNLAYAAGLTPQEYRTLRALDELAVLAEEKGRADGELGAARTLYNAARNGDAKAALEILKHRHEWVAKQQVQIDVNQQISILDALAQAESRAFNVIEHEPQPTETPQLPATAPTEEPLPAFSVRSRPRPKPATEAM